MTRVAAIALVTLAACGAGDERHDDDEAVDCDAAVMLLAHFDESGIDEVRRAGETTVVVVYTDPPRRTGEPAPAKTLSIVALDGCGLEPRTIAEDLEAVDPAPLERLPWVVAFQDDAATPGHWLLDPFGGRTPLQLAPVYHDTVGWSEHGPLFLLDRGAQGRALVELSVDGDGELHERLLHADVDGLFRPDKRYVTSQLMLSTSSGESVLLDIAAPGVDTIARGDLSVFPVDWDTTRYFVMTAAVARGRGTWVHDRLTGDDLVLGRPAWTDLVWRPLEGVVVAIAGAETDASAETQLVLLPELRELWWPAAGMYDDAALAPDGTRLFVQGEILLRLAPGAEYPEHVELELPPRTTRILEVFTVGEELQIAARGWPNNDGVQLTRWFRLAPGGTRAEPIFDEPVLGAFQIAPERWAYFVNGSASGWIGDLWFHDESSGNNYPIAAGAANGLAWLNQRVDPPRHSGVAHDFLFVSDDTDAGASLWQVLPDRLARDDD